MKKTVFVLLVSLSVALGVQAQQEKSEEPDDYTYELPDMPTLRPDYDLDRMPNKDITSFSTDQQTGEPIHYTDPKSKLHFNFREREITDFNTGKVYSFDDFSDLLKKEKPNTKPRQDSIITL